MNEAEQWAEAQRWLREALTLSARDMARKERKQYGRK
jgi:hypothetical protein